VDKMSLQKLNKKGFTIIELLIVIVVIGILAALVLTAYGNIQARARDTERTNDISEIHKQLELNYTDDTSTTGNGSYPSVLSTTTVPNLNAEVLVDPNGDAYSYTGTGCTGTECTGYTLTVDLEAGGTFSRPSLN
jgi:general secretion pathway protein G